MKKEEFYKEALPNSRGPLEGVQVLEATTTQAGPVAGAILVDLGAVSIKVDAPVSGELGRHIPPLLDIPNKMEASTYYQTLNRGKKGITLALNKPEGQEIFRQLAKKMDVIIQNYKPGTMEKWGLGYQDIRKLNPNIIYVSLSGYGQFGPYRHKPGYDPIGQAMSGFMSITGFPDGPPMKSGGALADNLSGWQGAIGTLAALYYRSQTGKGQHVETSLVDAMLGISDWGIMMAANLDMLWERKGNAYGPVGLDPVVKCKDDYICLLVALDSHWAKLCKIMGREDLIEDPRTKTLSDRAQHPELVNGVIADWAKERTASEAVKILEEADLAVSPILNFKQIIEDKHIQERDMIAEVEHPLAGKLKLYGVPTKYSLTPAFVKGPAPMFGQHNEEIYGGLLGLSKEKIEELKNKGII
jgi:crotonobetainyl-CoA:carnitine CoA-transferase CaiB-like acyl-CoA transferase